MQKKDEKKLREASNYNIEQSDKEKFNLKRIQNELESQTKIPELSKGNIGSARKSNQELEAESFNALNESAISNLSAIDPSLGKSNISNYITRERNKLITPRVEKMLKESPRIGTKNILNLYDNSEYSGNILNQAFIADTPRKEIEPSSGLHRLISEIAGENYFNTIEDVTYLDRLDKQKLLFDIEKKNIEISQLKNLLQDLQQEYGEKSQRISDELKKQNATLFDLNKENQNLKIQLQENIQRHEQRIESMKRMIETKDIDIEKVRFENIETIDALNLKIKNLEEKLRDRSLNLISRQRASESVYPSVIENVENIKSKLDDCQLQNKQLTESLILKNQELDMSVQTIRRLQADIQNLSGLYKKCNEQLEHSLKRKEVQESEVKVLKSKYDMLEKDKLYFPINISRVISDIQKKIQDSNKIITQITESIESMKEKTPELILHFQKDIISHLKTMQFYSSSLSSAIYEIVSKNENIKIFQSNRVYLQYALGQISYQDAITQLGLQELKQDDTILERIRSRFEFSKKLSDYILSENIDFPSDLDSNQSVLVRRVASLKKIAAEKVQIQKECDIYKNAIDHILYEKELDIWSQEKQYNKMIISIDFLKSKLQKFDKVISKFDELERNYSGAKRELRNFEKKYSEVSSDQKYLSNVLFSCYRFMLTYIKTEADLDNEVSRLQAEIKPSKLTIENVNKIIVDFKTTKINIGIGENKYRDLLEIYKDIEKKYRDLLEKFNTRDADFSNLTKIKEDLENSATQIKILEDRNESLSNQILQLNLEKEQLFYITTDLKYQLNDSQRLILEAQGEIQVLQSVSQKYADELRKKSELVTKEYRCREKYKELKTLCIRKIEYANSKINGFNQLKKLHKSTLSKQAKSLAFEKLQYQQFIKSMELQHEEYERVIHILENQAQKTDIRLNALRTENKELRKQLIKVGKTKQTEVTTDPSSLKMDIQISTLENELKEKDEELKNMTESYQNISDSYQKIYADNQRHLSSIKEFEIKFMSNNLELKSKDNIINDLNDIVTTLKDENKKIKSEIEANKKLIPTIQKQVLELTNENKQKEVQISELTEKFDNCSKSLQLEYDKNAELNALLQEQKKISKNQINIKDRLYKTLDEALNARQASLDKLNIEVETLKEELKNCNESSNKREDEYSLFKLDYEKSKKDQENLIRENNLLKEKIAKIINQHKIIVNRFMNKISLQNKVLKNLENNLITEEKIEKTRKKPIYNESSQSSTGLRKMKSYFYPRNKNSNTQYSKGKLEESKSYTFGSIFKSEN
jgi:hypothetical protein